MGGDHQCSVCQATFTRPQHVARHMRSRKLTPHLKKIKVFSPGCLEQLGSTLLQSLFAVAILKTFVC